ncbi:hypothetical protein J7337_004431 [Fusarium musae]|uniref:Uncharacterized protein n=1 Tax=Fusarium musae TaxID=1042133 RepID=A0A9P8IT78_9HYPO|nr:hypothetical protein J7337_004431 [Fusarium musae]KAG9504458.1 hypothetical protein J7337_004431 [Fusarium musae]
MFNGSCFHINSNRNPTLRRDSPSVLYTLGDAVESALNASSQIADSVPERTASVTSRGGYGIAQTSRCGSGDSPNCATQAADSIANGTGEEVKTSSDRFADVAGWVAVLVAVVVHDSKFGVLMVWCLCLEICFEA